MIRRSEFGPRCTHCGNVNPASTLEEIVSSSVKCIHCERSFTFWIEKLPFYCTEDRRAPRCDCEVCTGKQPAPSDEAPPNG